MQLLTSSPAWNLTQAAQKHLSAIQVMLGTATKNDCIA